MNILLVTEDSSYRLLVRKYLSDEGFTVSLATDVREGMRTIRTEKIDLVIADLVMKIMDGFDFCSQARGILGGKEIPFVLVSIYDDEVTKMKAQMMKNSGFIRKGAPFSEMITLINHLMTPEDQGGGLESFTSSPANIPNPPKTVPQIVDTAAENTHLTSRILLVDDDDNFRKVLGDTLSDEGYSDLTQAIDGGEAIEFLRDQHFDLVLLDIIMPNVSGFGVLKFIHENVPSTKTIMLTAYADMKLAVEAKQLGAADFIAKPFMRDDLLKTINQVLSQQ